MSTGLPYIVVPTYANGKWTTTSFDTRMDFRLFVEPLLKIPGEYGFDQTSFIFNEEARKFTKEKTYCVHYSRTKEFIEYWDDQSAKCRNGVIYRTKGKTWYVPRDYYMWINFLPIYDKVKFKFDFPEVWDSQYHMALHECIAELRYEHEAILKKRQFGSSYFHTAKLINQIWFEEGVPLKMGASHEDFINNKGSWKFLTEYKDFLNANTAWKRPMNPGKVLEWQQQILVERSLVGLKGTISGFTFERDPTNGVGGGCKYFFHEEGGVAPKADVTYEFIRPAMKSGNINTGVFIIAGTVGDLEQCEPLKKFVLDPEANGMFCTESNLVDSKGTIAKTGLFIPEQWSMPPFIDKFGNSDVQGALAFLEIQDAEWKRTLSPEIYQLRRSQHPRNIEEAFAFRKESRFPQHLVTAQLKRIEDREYPYECIDLSYDDMGKIKASISKKIPILEFPVTAKTLNKEGVLQVWERPDKNATFGTYYGSIDPISEGKTTTSKSLCAIYIYKNAVQVTRHTSEGSKTFIEGDKVVAAWCGRFDDLKKTHEYLEMIIEWYKAWTIVENNVSLFIQYMVSKRKQKYLAHRTQITFLKELEANKNVYQEYGWKNSGDLFDVNMLGYSIAYLTEEIDTVVKEDGEVVSRKFGVERIPDAMLLHEMRAHKPKLNVDRLVAFSALITFVKIQQANRGFKKRVEENVLRQNLEKTDNFTKLERSAFIHIGKSSSFEKGTNAIKRRPFKNF